MHPLRNTAQRDMLTMAAIICISAAMSMSIAGLGIINFLNGNSLRAAVSLTVPTFLIYWAWQIRDNLNSEPLIPIFGLAWLGGLPLGLAIHSVPNWVF